MPRLRIKELAEAQNLNISQLQRKANITMGTARRYWYGTKDGKASGPSLEELNIPVLTAIANVLEVSIRDLLSEEDWHTLQLAAA